MRARARPFICLILLLTACRGEPEPIIIETPALTVTPAIDATPTAKAADSPTRTPRPPKTSPSPQPAGKVNINTADERALDSLPHIGPALAQRIIAHRQAHGPFKSIDAIKDVPGIGDAIFDAIRDRLTIQD